MKNEIEKLYDEFFENRTFEKINEILNKEESANAYYYRATFYLDDNDLDNALNDLLKALDMIDDFINSIQEKMVKNMYGNLDDNIYLKKMLGGKYALKSDIIYALDYIYSIRKEYDKLTKFNYRNKNKEDILEYLNTLSDDGEDGINKAIGYMNINDIENARTLLFKLLETNKKSFQIYYNLGKIKAFEKNCGEADEFYNLALEIEPNNINALHNKAYNLEEINYNESIKYYEKVLSIDPHANGTRYNLGRVYYNIGEYNKALENYNLVIEFNPNYMDAYYSRGELYCQTSKYNKALIDFSTAIKLDPYFVFNYIEKAKTLYKMRDTNYHEEILELLDKAEEIENSVYSIFLYRGFVYERENKLDEAESQFNKAIELGEYPEIYIALSKIYEKQGKLNRAIEAANNAKKSGGNDEYNFIINELNNKKNGKEKSSRPEDEGDVEVYSAIKTASMLYFQNNYKEALKIYKKVLEEVPNDYLTLYNVAACHGKLGNNNRALFYYRKSIKSYSEFPSAYNNMGLIYEVQGLKNRALKMYKFVEKKFPEYATSIGNIASLYYEKEKFEEAIKYFNKYIELSSNPDAFYDRGRSYLKVNKFEEAIVDFDECIKNEYHIGNSKFFKGFCLFKLNNFKEAKILLEESKNFDELSSINKNIAINLLKKIEKYINKK